MNPSFLARDGVRGLYPAIEAYDSGFLDVGDGHRMFYEQAGNPSGKPVIVLHGGPGGGSDAMYRQPFDPRAYRVIQFDQRGCGKSTPHAGLDHNTTWDLVADTEKLRKHLKIERWQVFGGSWGSTLALAYAITHPTSVTEMILRGIFLLRESEIRWFYQEGASQIFPDAWEGYLAPIPVAERGNLVAAYHKRLTSSDSAVRLEAARAWAMWEGCTSRLVTEPLNLERFSGEDFALAFARIECHYFFNRGFMKSDNYLIENIDKIRHIPAVIVQGRYDVVCPVRSAWDLHRAWPESDLWIIPDAGHSFMEPGITRALCAATERFKR